VAEFGLKEPSYLGKSARPILSFLPLLAVAGAVGLLVYLWLQSLPTAIQILGGLPKAIGQSTPVKLRYQNPHGVRRITAVLNQQGKRLVAFERRQAAVRLTFLGRNEPPGEIDFTIGKQITPELTPGKAHLSIEVEGDLPVALERPRVAAEQQPVFLRRGGTGLVAFTVSGDWSEAGVRVGRYTFPSWPAGSRRVSLFGYPPGLPAKEAPMIYARNAAGEESTAAFPHHVTGEGFRERTLNVPDSFIAKVVTELDPSGAGLPADRYARINSETRRANDEVLAALNTRSEPRALWQGAFLMLPKAKAEARFGDHRTYVHKGRKLNVEWHLGVDLASTSNAPLPAGNNGKVLFAGPLGIYGNCVAIDHGLGLISAYGHMSRIDVKEGDTVTRGQRLGATGSTGLAAGDHVHVALLLNGVFVDPVEWSFARWMDKSVMPLVGEIQ
jgi:murein DD-endopeptidase MepM/ murein hydrolase activator NlpD